MSHFSSQDNITYDELLRTLIHENERILTKDWRLTYRQATFYDCESSHGLSKAEMPVIDSLPSGAAILTNKRLLLLSAQVHNGELSRQYGDGLVNYEIVEMKRVGLGTT